MKTLQSILLNAAFIAAIWFATHGNKPCGNVVYFACAILTLCAVVLLPAATMMPDKLPHISKSRQVVSHISDFMCLLLLVWFGWWWCAVAIAFQSFVRSVVFDVINGKK